MPGYGYAAASKEKIASWTGLMQDFLRGRAPLLRVFLLVDGRHGLKPVDAEMMDLLDRSAVSYQIVLTKRDEVKAGEQDQRDRGDAERARQAPGRLSAGDLHLRQDRRRHRRTARRDRQAAGRTRLLKAALSLSQQANK